MDKESRKIFDKIIAKDPELLTKNEKEFLRARSSYLTKEQTKQFASILKKAK